MADQAAKNPNLFLVGVQRSATTAMWSYLRQHPEVYMAQKELHHFGMDLGRFGDKVNFGARPSRMQYLAHFEKAQGERYLGDASVGYSYSTSAAGEIREFCPEARVIVSFRNPVDMAYSLHSLMRFQGAEPEPSFERAVADEEAARWAHTAWPFRWAFTYPRLLAYAGQLQRLYDTFGRERVHVVLYEDFVADPGTTFRHILEFLDVNPDFTPEFTVVNANRELRSPLVERWVKRAPGPVRVAARLLVPSRSARRRLGRRAIAANRRDVRRAPLDPEVRARVEARLAPEVEALGALLGRDLGTAWTPPSLAAR